MLLFVNVSSEVIELFGECLLTLKVLKSRTDSILVVDLIILLFILSSSLKFIEQSWFLVGVSGTIVRLFKSSTELSFLMLSFKSNAKSTCELKSWVVIVLLQLQISRVNNNFVGLSKWKID